MRDRWAAATTWVKGTALAERFIRRNPWFYRRAKRQLELLQAAPSDARRIWTDRRLRTVLRTASETRYGKSVSGSEALETWPLLERDQLRDDPHAFIRGRGWFAAPASSGGTTGVPIRLLRSAESVVVEQVCLDLLLERLAVDSASARVAVLRGDYVKDPADLTPPFWVSAAGGRRLVFSSNHLGPGTIGAFADALAAFQPDVLWGYPTSLESLCHLLRHASRRLTVERALSSSEVLAPHVWKTVGETLECILADHYGQAERVAWAYALHPGEYWFVGGYAHIELVRVESDESGSCYEIVGTPLWNTAMPLVRYRTGDVVRVSRAWGDRELREVCLGVRPFGGVRGRDGDVLLSPDGLPLTGIDHIHRDVEQVRRIQVIQETLGDVRILVLAANGYSALEAAQLLRNARRKLPPTMRVTVQRVERLERTATGKAPFVIHRPLVKAMLRD